MHAAALRAELRLPDTHSLKEKRRKMRSVLNELDKFDISVAEVDNQDTWQRATLGIAIVAAQYGHLDRRIHSIERTLRNLEGAELLEVDVSHLERP